MRLSEEWHPIGTHAPLRWSWVAVAVGVGSAAVGAYGARQQANAANKPRNSTTDQTTTQDPYMSRVTDPDIISIVNMQRALVNQGPQYITGPRGIATGAPGAAPAPYGPDPRLGNRPTRTGDNPGGGGGAHGVNDGDQNYPGDGSNYGVNTKTFGGHSMAQLAADPKLVNRLSAQDLRAYNQARKGGGATPVGGAPGGGGGGGSLANLSGNALIEQISRQAAQQGLDAGNSPTVRQAQSAVGNILGESGGGGPEQTGFEGYNPINDRLARRLEGEPTDADTLLRNFMGTGSGGAGGGGSDADALRPTSQIWTGNPTGGTGGWGGQGGSGGNQSGGGSVPDTVGGNNSYFATQIRQLMDQGANETDIQRVIDAANADVTRGAQASLWDLDAQAQGTGRLGGDMWAGLGRDIRSDATRRMADQASRTRLDELGQRRSMQQNLLGQVNARDLGAMQDATQRYGIDQSAASASAGNAANAAATKRAQDLQALGMLVGHQEFNTGQLSGLGERLSTDRLSAIGMVPGIEGVGLAGLGAANSAAGNLVGLRGAENALAASRMQAGVARQGLNQQAQIYNAGAAQNQINDYLRTIGAIGSMGGTSRTVGTNVVPGAGISPTGAAFQGAAGGFLAGYGTARQYGAGG